MSILRKIGAQLSPNGLCTFTVWAPELEKVALKLTHPVAKTVAMQKTDFGYWSVMQENITPGTRYFFELNGQEVRPDPASHFQPEGVHESSAVVDHNYFAWTDKNWRGLELEDYIIYELHTGTFTPEHTFEGIISKLDYLLELGITAIEIMPVAQFPGERNWGYDGVYPFAVQNSYGGPDGLKKMVNACHEKGIAVVLDVVYNHLGPEGNYLRDFGPYFTEKYKTPWGSALNFDDAHADGVRNFFIQNALMWFRDFHVDALRLDAVHAIMDFSARHFLEELADETKKLSAETGREFLLIAESDLNDVRLINPQEKGGYGLHAQWNDEFHHALHTVLTKENAGYYADFGSLKDLEKAFKHTFVFNGNYAPHRRKSYGNNADENPGKQFVVCLQNHDQVGNRMRGDRLTEPLSFRALKLAAATYILSPYLPMLFMGEEYGEKNPFQYFISHTDKNLVEAVQKGRKEEFKGFQWAGQVPDPQSEETFRNSSLTWQYQEGEGKELWNFYRHLISLRKSHEIFRNPDKTQLQVSADETKNLLTVERWNKDLGVKCFYNFSKEPIEIALEKNAGWKLLLNSAYPEIPENALPAKLKLDPESVIIIEQKPIS
ncbi:malto-oligosyltrehalose trehalohydrolase [Adhaeribacter sp. BT258]|uniref:Malto-oligosyltrehalose trehalohydrolase n=1 Tax=Adhaeribacter terrigena TaxID=2793070 RepID=A0ABS1C0Y3_9BACT|nr:malto-oligosyltrehalose trehalohydrolase [Adhaeribacter terrigena]MBK0402990.1 malto-oligosyltrehalose trehalohydrolase [Adhaeribacter terrigena]